MGQQRLGSANTMHTCSYEGWCTREDLEKALGMIKRLVREVSKR